MNKKTQGGPMDRSFDDDGAQPDGTGIHDTKVRVVQVAIVDLFQSLGPSGMTASAVAEGAIKAAAVVMLADRGASLDDVAGILEDFARALRTGGGAELVRH